MSETDNSERIRMYRKRISDAQGRIVKYNRALGKIALIREDLNSAVIRLENAIDGLKQNFIKDGVGFKKKELEKEKDKINKVLDQFKRIVIPQINEEIVKEKENISDWQDRIDALQD